ncbi:unnamed protein product [Pylaiella littoralis]
MSKRSRSRERQMAERCHLRGCSLKGTPYFCCARHEQMAENRREWPRCDEETTVSLDDPGNPIRLNTPSPQLNFELNFLDDVCPEYGSLLANFVSNWKHKKPTEGVSVVSVIKITMPVDVSNRHEAYKEERVVSNVCRRYHGTSRSDGCRFHVGESMCLRQDCALCSICQVGFKLGANVGHSPVKHAKTRYGRGIYFSSVSGKANDFAKRTAEVDRRQVGSPKVRFMLVADVVAGESFVTTETNFQHLASPPQGYDSVVGKVRMTFARRWDWWGCRAFSCWRGIQVRLSCRWRKTRYYPESPLQGYDSVVGVEKHDDHRTTSQR